MTTMMFPTWQNWLRRVWSQRSKPHPGSAPGWAVATWLLVIATISQQIAYPLVDDPGAAADNTTLRLLTQTTVVSFAAASFSHTAWRLGWRRAAGCAAWVISVGLAAEWVGTHTGFPFGQYAYANTLGPEVMGVPVLIGAAWWMMAWPTYIIAGRVVAWAGGGSTPVTPAAAIGLGAVAMMGWDLFLDPQMVAAGHWSWRPGVTLPGIDDIPVTNFLGWFLVALLLHAGLWGVSGRFGIPDGVDDSRPATDPSAAHQPTGTAGVGGAVADWVVPAVLWAWTWCGSALAAAVWFGNPAAAGYGFVVMGVTLLPAVVPFARRVLTGAFAVEGNDAVLDIRQAPNVPGSVRGERGIRPTNQDDQATSQDDTASVAEPGSGQHPATGASS